MANDAPQRKLVAKMIYTHFSAGERVSDTQWAEPLADGRYRIHSMDRKPVDLAVGEAWGGTHSLSVNSDGRAVLREWILPTGRDILVGVTAKPKGNADKPTGYIIRNRGGAAITIEKGVPHRTYGEVSIDEFGNLATQAGCILLTKKTFEISLLVFSERINGGYLAYMNRLEPGHKSNRKDGTKGIFYPARGANQPAKFWELISADHKVNTGVIWPPKNGGAYCTIETHTPEEAEAIDRTDREMKRFAEFARGAGLNPADVQYYKQAERENLDAKQHASKYPFRIMSGSHILFPDSRSRTPNR